MKPTLPLLALALLLPAAAQAGPTQIAQLPLLNVTGTGLVKPNLMVLYDNSGSMASNYTPDYVDDSSTCRSRATLASGTRGCLVGDPPFSSGDFNKQYYNPDLRYAPPVTATGVDYPIMNRATTSGWTVVTTDGFAVNRKDMRNVNATNTNLVTSFPDYKWCLPNDTNNCVENTATYTYPDNTYYNAQPILSNPYYYRINVAEHCTTAALTTCIETAIGAAAPAGYQFPARVRWCDSRALTNCQAKYVGNFKYPRFSNAAGGKVSFGTITIAASNNNSSRSISSLTVSEGGTTRTISNGTMTASSGLNSTTKQAQFATIVAASIVAKTGLPNQYTGCVRSPDPVGAAPDCDDYGVSLASDAVVGVVPVNCIPTATGKEIGDDCALVLDNVRAGWTIAVNTSNVTATTTAITAGNAIFSRIDIVSSRASYPRHPNRTDCTGGSSCTYDEEMTNFGNWYAYYKTRNQMMKAAVGLAFNPVSSNFNVGIVSLSTAGGGGAISNPKVFSGADRTAWYTALYAMNGSSYTPTRAALHNIGKMYANLSPYNRTAGQEAVMFPCQQNFTFVTSDGYWNSTASPVGQNDAVESAGRFCTRSRGCVDTRSQSIGSLADIALYWYNGGSTGTGDSLRPDLEDFSKPGLVPAAAGENTRLHMTTYTLGLGMDGLMTYEPNYDTSPRVGGDFYKLITGGSGCPWNSNGTYVWPDPQADDVSTNTFQARVDDLWHAAVNGRGKYFSAADPEDVVTSLTAALNNIQAKVGAAAAAATSTPNISQQDNDIFSDTFTTVKWYGELSDKKVNTVTGVVSTTAVWISSDTVGRKVSAASDTRNIKMLVPASRTLKNFEFSVMTAAEKAWFSNKCSLLAQCPALSTADRAIVDSGANIVNWLRGQQQHANDVLMRAYTLTDHNPPGLSAPIPIVLGDIASSKPAFMREPRKEYTLAGYNDFVVANTNRQATVFVAANDGMLHAFNAGTGEELWGYVPRITMNKLYRQAGTTYGTNHQYTTDGSPEVADVQIGGVWKTILVAGLNGGGRGYYAIDVTDPNNPRGLWETCADGTICTGDNLEPEMGLSFGNPQFGLWNNQWVVFVTSGYNNIPGSDGVAGGSGLGYLMVIDVATGRVLRKVATTGGSTDTPSGLAKISAITSNPASDPVVSHIYGGDNLGQMWRFDLTSTAGAIVATKMGNAGPTQPITTRPEVTSCRMTTTAPDGSVTNGAQRVVVFGTGRLLDVPDVSNGDLQSIYMVKDSALEVTPWKSLMVQQTLSLLSSSANMNQYKITANDVNLSVKNGWYVNLSLNAKERVNLDPKVVAGSVTVVTNTPASSTSCSVGGSSNVYRLDVCTGSFIDNSSAERVNGEVVAGETLSATSAAVGFIMVRLPTGVLKMITTTADGQTITGKGPATLSHESRMSGWRRVKN